MLQPLLSEQASQQLVDSIVSIAEKVAIEKARQSQKRWLRQNEVMKEYRCTHSDITKWECLGLRKRKQGKSWYYDRKDIEEVLESLKQ
ncbi:DNA-binding protein [Staphylococcus coagulans]|uniref:DNA-binding protein n=1 Tax=Staphylococcus coagulans TaxID=74706 RepID=UPI0015F8A6CE|nr:DNA-binding protein [Staphylococcus coagulans]MBA8764187.1 DNA-binding protein [Staphylococcus coagulans]MBT2810395.1 DNA-binding protein [Staphylococcus coagulans]MBT2811789.1 DNA-binding protein [Staphylococcus coagulans]MBT2819100.1 DNA-binding protein [Staphylococcus coagulans]MBT2821913.1 DNA-binding protein [Staphylococcus coagulans]